MTTAQPLGVDCHTWSVNHLPMPVTLTAGRLDPTPDDRATWAAGAVKSYAYAVPGEPGEPVETVICDLLSDLLHLADALDIDLQAAFDTARRDYAGEVA